MPLTLLYKTGGLSVKDASPTAACRLSENFVCGNRRAMIHIVFVKFDKTIGNRREASRGVN